MASDKAVPLKHQLAETGHYPGYAKGGAVKKSSCARPMKKGGKVKPKC